MSGSVDIETGRTGVSESERPFPRLLVINSFRLGDQSASGHMLRNLLCDWPRTELAYLNVGGRWAAKDLLAHSWAEPGIFGRFVGAGRYLRRRNPDQGNVGGGIDSGSGTQWLKSALLAWLEVIPIRPNREMSSWIQRFRPQVIYTWLGTPAIHSLVREVAVRWKVPTVVHVMDDWVSCKHANNWLAAPSRRALVRSFEREIAAAAECIAISDNMAEAYRMRYGRDFNVISNGIDMTRFPLPEAQPDFERGSKRLVLAHVGRVSHGRMQGLSEIVSALRILADRGVRVRLELLGMSRDNLPMHLRDSAIVHCDPDASDESVRRLGAEVNAFLQVESFDSSENNWFRLSLSAKLPLYLALGRPVVAYGPRDLGSIEYVESAGCGVVVGEQSVDALVAALQKLADDPVSAAKIGRCARSLAEARHDRRLVCAQFREILTRATKG